MNNNPALLRTLIIYAICVPLAIVLGSLATSAAAFSSRAPFIEFGLLILLLCTPFLLRWHYLLLIFCWNLPMIIFFLPGSPGVWMPVLMVSLGISVLQRTINQNLRFIPARQIAWPLLCLMLVVLVTAKLTGGIGLNALGSEVMGGKKYVFLLAGIMGFFAFTARRISPQQARLYVALFFLSRTLSVMEDTSAFLPHSFNFLYLFFPRDYAYSSSEGGLGRLAGIMDMSSAIFAYMLARHGISGIFRASKPWRAAAFILFTLLSLAGGFRHVVIMAALTFSILFYLEGLHRTRLLPLFAVAGLLVAVFCLPFANRLPINFQRGLSFLPVKIDPVVRSDADYSAKWRYEMWKAVLPQVPHYLLLGKGYALSQQDLAAAAFNTQFNTVDPSQDPLALSGDYHSGPLSVIMPLGIWGVIAFLWFLIAGLRALHRNRLYGDPALQTVNTYLFAQFLTRIITFFFIGGSLSTDILVFVGYLGFSISLNGGIRLPVREPAVVATGTPARLPVRPRLQPSFPR